jgi:protein-tyrosine phosphatase
VSPTLHSPHPAQQARQRLFGVAELVDVHCHCLPGLDDGPGTADEAVALCRALVADGTTTVLATPHQFGPYDLANSADRIRAAVRDLQRALDAAAVPLTVHPGADVRVDERLVPMVRDGGVLGLGPMGRHVLLELPHEAFVDLRGLIRELAGLGRLAVVSHPERHPHLVRRPEALVRWLDAGATLQVTAGSLVGAFGPAAEAAAWQWLEQGMVAVVASDAHDARRRPPAMTAAIERISARLGSAFARTVCVDNPLAVLRGQDVPPVRKPVPTGARRPRP